METGGVIIHSRQLAQLGANGQRLKSGSQVLVRILADKGGGRYEGSVAGVRVNVRSALPLRPGTTFTAKVSVQDGQVQITPENPVEGEKPGLSVTLLDMELSSQEPQLAQYLRQLGLESDSVSLHVLRQFLQLEQKISPEVISRIKRLAVRFAGKEKSAAEILTILQEKGLDATEEEISALLLLLEHETGSGEDAGSEPLSLLNRINRAAGRWFLLPFELVESDSSERCGAGCIRLLLSPDEKLRLVNLDCEYGGGRYLFSIEFSGKRPSLVRMNIPSLDEHEAEAAVRALSGYFLRAGLQTEVRWAELPEVEGSACGGERLYAVEGAV